ncbi:hypothetical protein GPECTOR_47g365 [Gonium pectorale]|uniref:Uncharacterized protein n=1 Tax=Gonium pectorale TaxID=33097 RepID=A0A150G8A7_GONPE|nr:hypothetical protein GPECTOR_47g365 [Gonium pectorale]|eukprot:KXZ46089.1 hypothetical protein GPECTOR_47g365 [Gonium pectorale]
MCSLIGAITLLLRTESAIESFGVFSANEDKDDLATGDMKYLLVPFYRASLLSAAPVPTDGGSGASAARLAAVNRALPALGAFLQRCEQYGLLGALGSSGLEVAMGGAVDPTARRNFKVEKFKRERALNGALGALEARRAAAAAQEDEASSSASASTAAAASSAGAGVGGGGPLDEEDERQLWTWRLELAALQALDLQAALRQEAELLQHAAAREAAAAAAGPGPSSSAGRPGPSAGSGGLDGPDDVAKAALLARLRDICRDLDGNRKEQMRRDVFKPGHILPTMTVEEAGEIEHREAMEREERQRRQEEKERARRAALDSDEEDAEDKAQQRARDDWRDAHPRGYGNSKLRPCG